MSSSSSSSKEIFPENQKQQFDGSNVILTPIMNFDSQPQNQLPTSTTRIIIPRPFYRSRLTPDRFDTFSSNRQTIDKPPQRRYSVNQINGNFERKHLYVFIFHA